MAMPSPSRSSSSRVVAPNLNLPAGFRFHPTDEELIVHYLMNQAASIPCPVPIIAEVNIYQWNPWDLPGNHPTNPSAMIHPSCIVYPTHTKLI